MSTSTARPISKLVEFSTCEISDALIKLKLPHGGYIPDIHMLSPSASESSLRICGPAYTVRMVSASDTAAPKLSAHFVDTAPEGSVVVIGAPPEVKNAVWGGLMTTGAQARLAQGVIISGRCRDLSEHRSLGFPVFARGHSTLGQSPFTRPSEINIPLTIKPIPSADFGGAEEFPAVTIQPGDWMVADEDGVVCVPRELEDRVIELTVKGRHIDNLCMEDIKAGKGVQVSFKLHRGK
ncbi:RraA-like protein [Macrolepiota fuliginosa MF-IS2]|uniref:RraA-like protein n=1 Tax=Macrolepiota fuliginosa MF-IS2 TaxID=1400762 RepID=A0A9P5XLM4_9AGAR|nr:RraA-like protein [Macrolepiota fuliginosa MF-IS2]